MNSTGHTPDRNRRTFLKGLTLTIGSSVIGLPLLSFCSDGSAGNAPEEMRSDEESPQKRKLGIALVGLGGYSTHQLAPALQETKNCYLAGIVTGTPAKAEAWKAKYKIPDKNIYNYQNFDQIVNNKDIDIVYVVLPNAMHAEFTIRAAKAKKHVICEKPMATSVEDAQRMLEACRQNKVQLAIGYRLHYDPFHQRVMDLGQNRIFGNVQSIRAHNAFDMGAGSSNSWRVDKERAGGGPLMDMGIYCVQAACYTMGKAPVAVTATFGEVTRPELFKEVEQSINWKMEFENGVIAECFSSYSDREDFLEGKAEKGWWRLGPAFGYEGKRGETSQGKMNYPNIFEQASQMDGQAESFRNNKPSIVPGEMGLRDVKILMAIYASARDGGKRVPISYT
ncbi:Gfo/Idh/MocA family protein [Rufibacter tibetensis]|uniref:Glucose-fructose oxidoreductase n=1 Tax=Rufibacter tibetensis TaxID=512763 RepID=A0A0P0CB82_9BACT|nr:Gfo/Idh/MocA family oxidoreductase [Rufibacter tibetensis]ALJ00909.1 glucose-fructose oxidoreductase [Rufibacter tibetensis]